MATSEQFTKMALAEAERFLASLYERQFCHCLDCSFAENSTEILNELYTQGSDEPILGLFSE